MPSLKDLVVVDREVADVRDRFWGLLRSNVADFDIRNYDFSLKFDHEFKCGDLSSIEEYVLSSLCGARIKEVTVHYTRLTITYVKDGNEDDFEIYIHPLKLDGYIALNALERKIGLITSIINKLKDDLAYYNNLIHQAEEALKQAQA